ncbi:AMP-binding protein [Streptomyces sp. NPDC051211]|uniref:AMP-binding protein n=1 Tax=Streptomyces sp. NPDC051211 TaxID=3154643 RepID=UPI00344ED5D5
MTQEPESSRSGPRTTDTVTRRFEQWARDTPDAPAVVSGRQTLGYGELDERANRLARHLLAAGLPPGATAAVAVPDPADTLVAVLAVLKAGGAYALLDPEDRLAALRQLGTIRPYVLLTLARYRPRLDSGSSSHRVIGLDAEAAGIAAHDAGAPRTAPGDTAAVLFTGGTEPRPVRTGHARLLAAHDAWAETARFGPDDRHLITARPDVPAFAAGWTRALCSGGALIAAGAAGAAGTGAAAGGAAAGGAAGAERAASAGLRRLIDAEAVSVLHTDPAALAGLLAPLGDGPAAPAELNALRLITVTGDRLYAGDQAVLHGRLRPGVRLLNVYGTAETAGTGTWFELPQLSRPLDDPDRRTLLGIPFPGCRVDLRDGEILLTPPDGGDAVPTGDLGLLRADGLLEFAGRARDRITAGRRTVDPYRIESAIRQHPAVGGALVRSVSDGPLQQRLVAYLAPAARPAAAIPAPRLPDAATLRAHLSGSLPAEEIPVTVVRLPALPRNRAGQEDRTALPLPPKPAAVRSGSGKYGALRGDGAPAAMPAGCATVLLAVLAFFLTDAIWPGSTELAGVPGPWAALFFVLHLFECLAFAAGVVFLFAGRDRMLRTGRPRALATAAHLAVVYLLVAWWPQDNFYRLAAKTDWPRQAALVYTFNIPLMLAAAIVALYLTRKPADRQ